MCAVARRPATEAEQHKLRRLDDPIVATFISASAQESFEVASSRSLLLALLGPLATASDVAEATDDHLGAPRRAAHRSARRPRSAG